MRLSVDRHGEGVLLQSCCSSGCYAMLTGCQWMLTHVLAALFPTGCHHLISRLLPLFLLIYAYPQHLFSIVFHFVSLLPSMEDMEVRPAPISTCHAMGGWMTTGSLKMFPPFGLQRLEHCLLQRSGTVTALSSSMVSVEEPAFGCGSLQLGLRGILFPVGISAEKSNCALTWTTHYWKSRGQFLPCHHSCLLPACHILSVA